MAEQVAPSVFDLPLILGLSQAWVGATWDLLRWGPGEATEIDQP